MTREPETVRWTALSEGDEVEITLRSTVRHARDHLVLQHPDEPDGWFSMSPAVLDTSVIRRLPKPLEIGNKVRVVPGISALAGRVGVIRAFFSSPSEISVGPSIPKAVVALQYEPPHDYAGTTETEEIIYLGHLERVA